MRRIFRGLLAAVAILAGTVAVNAATPGTAGAAITACSGMNNGWQSVTNGWFDTINGAVNCTYDGNHVVVDLYGPGGAPNNAYFQGVIDMWYPPQCFPVFEGSSSNWFRIKLFDIYGGPCVEAETHGWSTVGLPSGYHTRNWFDSGVTTTIDLTAHPYYCQGSGSFDPIEGWATYRDRGTNNGINGSAIMQVLSRNYSEGGGCIKDRGHIEIMVAWH